MAELLLTEAIVRARLGTPVRRADDDRISINSMPGGNLLSPHSWFLEDGRSIRFSAPYNKQMVLDFGDGTEPQSVPDTGILTHEYSTNGIYTAELHDPSGRLRGTLTFEIPNGPFSPRLVAANPAMRVPA